MAITSVGAVDSAVGAGITSLTLAVSCAIGDVRVLKTKVNSTTITVSSLSGGNVTTWTRVQGPTNDTNATVATHETWIGTCTSAGTTSITVTWSSSTAGLSTDLDCKTLNSGLGSTTTWTRDGTQSALNNNTSSLTVTFPTLTAAGNGEAYVGHARCPSASAYSSPVSCTSETDIDGNPFIVNLNVSAGAVTPTVTANATGLSYSTGVLLIASLLNPPPARPSIQAAHRAANW